MKQFLFLMMTIVLIMSAASSGFANENGVDHRGDKKSYFIGFHTGVDLGVIKGNGGEVKRQYKYMPVIAAKLPDKAVQALANHPKVAYIEEDGMVQATGQEIPWGVSHVKATDVHQTGVIGSGTKVGILDTGIDYTHEDLQVSGGATFVSGTSDYMDDNGHGTHVAGTVAAVNNTLGVIGIAPQTNLYAIKVLDQYGNGNYSDVIAGIEWAITNNLDIINMSLGGTTGSKTLQTAVDEAYIAGLLLVASAGNRGYDKKGTITYPAAYDSVIAVGAIDNKNNRANFSSVGRELELVAPGIEIQSTVPGSYGYKDGTSMAAPHVAGVAALVWAAQPSLSNVSLRSLLNNTAVYIGDPFSFGNGLVDAVGAINYSATSASTTSASVKGNNKN